IPTFLVSALARKHVTVSLSGDGGDELFCGYRHYSYTFRQRQIITSVPVPVRSLLVKVLQTLTSEDTSRFMSASLSLMPNCLSLPRLRRLVALASLTDPALFYDARQGRWHDAAEVVRGAREPISRNTHNGWPRCDDFIDHMMAVDTLTLLPDDFLVKVDRAAM